MIEIDYKDRSVLNALQRLDDRLNNLTPAMRDIAGVLTDATERAFQDEADPATGAPWAPLTEATVAMRGGDAHPILQRAFPAPAGLNRTASVSRIQCLSVPRACGAEPARSAFSTMASARSPRPRVTPDVKLPP